MAQDIPQWAEQRALELAKEFSTDQCWWGAHHALAKLVAAHETDPMLIEAREIAASVKRQLATDLGSMSSSVASNILNGKWDDHQLVIASYRALRRGMELSKQEPNP